MFLLYLLLFGEPVSKLRETSWGRRRRARGGLLPDAVDAGEWVAGVARMIGWRRKPAAELEVDGIDHHLEIKTLVSQLPAMTTEMP